MNAPQVAAPLDIAVLTCGPLGARVAEALIGLETVGQVTVFQAPYRIKRRGPVAKFQRSLRMDGTRATLSAALKRLVGIRSQGRGVIPANAVLRKDVPRLKFADFHEPDCLEALRKFNPDLGVVAGTYILGESVFKIPRLGSINLHSGKAPEYRGAAPAFWELYNGETEVGITIHRVASHLDAGQILIQETFPLDPAPPVKALDYVQEYRKNILEPAGIQLLCRAVDGLARGTLRGRVQDETAAQTYRSPDFKAQRELQRRVDERRREGLR